MKFFLERIAELLYEESGKDLKNHSIVFPGRRAGLYFLKYYSRLLDGPAWSPTVMTISEFFSSFSDLVVAENEILLFELYKVYRSLDETAGSFDDFYFWGDILINDFDDTDKYMVNASALFRNVVDIRNIDNEFGDLAPEVVGIIKRFWKNFEPEKNTREKDGFKRIWSVMPGLYENFRESLKLSGLAYEGMLFREVAEKFGNGAELPVRWERVHFVGFNALNNCELRVMKHFSDSGLGRFYWDYDNSYINNNRLSSAGYFLRNNLEIFKNDMPTDWSYDTNLSAPSGKVKWNVIETTSDIAQVKLIPGLIKSLGALQPDDAHHTAVVLADESLIVPALTSLPPGIGDINITMGYPLAMTGVYGLLKKLMELQLGAVTENGEIAYNYRCVIELLENQLVVNKLTEPGKGLIQEIMNRKQVFVPRSFLVRSPVTETLFHKPASPLEFSEYLRKILLLVTSGSEHDGDEAGANQIRLRKEFVYAAMLVVNRLEKMLISGGIDFSNETYIRIIDKVLRSRSVPFTGEPLSGIQVMGFLETRSLDFRNIIMLSVNEGVLPSVTAWSTFIPFSLREAFGLPVINHQESVYAYHFYRLLQRASEVTFVYNSDTSGLRSGEISRFLLQMKYEQELRPVTRSLSFNIRTPALVDTVLPKTQASLRLLKSLYSADENGIVLSPTAINTWLNCRMRFYYRYVCRLKEPDTFSMEIDPALFGEILHGVMKTVYEGSINTLMTETVVDEVIKNENKLRGLVNNAAGITVNPSSIQHPEGRYVIAREILLTYLLKILKTDRAFAPFTLIGLEKPVSFRLSANIEGEEFHLKTGGKADRIDRKDKGTRVVDYKTGNSADKIKSVKDLFEDDRKRELDGWLQTLVYCEAYLAENPGATVRPSIYRVRELSSDKFSDLLKVGTGRNEELLHDYQSIRQEFLEGLKDTVNIIFSPGEPFRMTSMINLKCNYCPYRGLCRR